MRFLPQARRALAALSFTIIAGAALAQVPIDTASGVLQVVGERFEKRLFVGAEEIPVEGGLMSIEVAERLVHDQQPAGGKQLVVDGEQLGATPASAVGLFGLVTTTMRTASSTSARSFMQHTSCPARAQQRACSVTIGSVASLGTT